MVSKIKVGDKAPDFTLPDVDLKTQKLKGVFGAKNRFSLFRWRFHFNMHKGNV